MKAEAPERQSSAGIDTPAPRWYEPRAPHECAQRFRPYFGYFITPPTGARLDEACFLNWFPRLPRAL